MISVDIPEWLLAQGALALSTSNFIVNDAPADPDDLTMLFVEPPLGDARVVGAGEAAAQVVRFQVQCRSRDPLLAESRCEAIRKALNGFPAGTVLGTTRYLEIRARGDVHFLKNEATSGGDRRYHKCDFEAVKEPG